MNNNGRYILVGKTPVPCEDLWQWAKWLEAPGNRIVKQEMVGHLFVSTIFLGLTSASYHMSEKTTAPDLFETMIFDHSRTVRASWTKDTDEAGLYHPVYEPLCYQQRYATWDAALAGPPKGSRDRTSGTALRGRGRAVDPEAREVG